MDSYGYKSTWYTERNYFLAISSRLTESFILEIIFKTSTDFPSETRLNCLPKSVYSNFDSEPFWNKLILQSRTASNFGCRWKLYKWSLSLQRTKQNPSTVEKKNHTGSGSNHEGASFNQHKLLPLHWSQWSSDYLPQLRNYPESLAHL